MFLNVLLIYYCIYLKFDTCDLWKLD